MRKVENRTFFRWIIIMLSAWLLWYVFFGVIYGSYVGFKIGEPIMKEFYQSDYLDNVHNENELTEDQRNYIKKRIIEEMRTINWWVWWPLSHTLAWLITSLFLGFMKVVRFNVGLVIITYIIMFGWRGKEWVPPGNIFIEAFTILLSIAVVHLVSRWICSKRMQAKHQASQGYEPQSGFHM